MTALHCLNPFVQQLWYLFQLPSAFCSTAQLVLHDADSAAEITAIMTFGNTTQSQFCAQQITIFPNDTGSKSISAVSWLWEPLTYSLLFPSETLGWGITGASSAIESSSTNAQTPDAATTQIWHYYVQLLWEHCFKIFDCLANEYLVDCFSHNIETKFNYISQNQCHIQQEKADFIGEPFI